MKRHTESIGPADEPRAKVRSSGSDEKVKRVKVEVRGVVTTELTLPRTATFRDAAKEIGNRTGIPVDRLCARIGDIVVTDQGTEIQDGASVAFVPANSSGADPNGVRVFVSHDNLPSVGDPTDLDFTVALDFGTRVVGALRTIEKAIPVRAVGGMLIRAGKVLDPNEVVEHGGPRLRLIPRGQEKMVSLRVRSVDSEDVVRFNVHDSARALLATAAKKLDMDPSTATLTLCIDPKRAAAAETVPAGMMDIRGGDLLFSVEHFKLSSDHVFLIGREEVQQQQQQTAGTRAERETSPNSITVVVVQPTKKAVLVDVNPEASIAELGERFAKAAGIGSEDVHLIFHGAVLSGDNTVSGCGISDMTTIHAAVRTSPLPACRQEEEEEESSASMMAKLLAPIYLKMQGDESTDTGIKFRIVVKTLTGHDVRLTVDSGWTVARLKLAVSEATDNPVTSQILTFRNNRLADGQKLGALGMTNGSKVFMILKLTGAKPVITFFPPTGTRGNIRARVRVSVVDPAVKIATTYPDPSEGKEADSDATWDCDISPSGSVWMVEGGSSAAGSREFSYLFWEFERRGRAPSGCPPLEGALADAPSTIFAETRNLSAILVNLLTALGLGVRERDDMITYWLGRLESFPCVLVRVCEPSSVDSRFPLSVSIDRAIRLQLLRLYLLFYPLACRPAAADRMLTSGQIPRNVSGAFPMRIDRDALAVVEWGAELVA